MYKSHTDDTATSPAIRSEYVPVGLLELLGSASANPVYSIDHWTRTWRGPKDSNLPDEEHLGAKVPNSGSTALHFTDKSYLRVTCSTFNHVWRGISNSPVEKPVGSSGY